MPMNLNEEVESIRNNFELISNELAKIIVGQKVLIRLFLWQILQHPIIVVIKNQAPIV